MKDRIKLFKGTNLKVLEKQVNQFLEEQPLPVGSIEMDQKEIPNGKIRILIMVVFKKRQL